MTDAGIQWGLVAGSFGGMLGVVVVGFGWTLLAQTLVAWRFGFAGGNRRAVVLVNAVTAPVFSLGFVVLLFAAQSVSWKWPVLVMAASALAIVLVHWALYVWVRGSLGRSAGRLLADAAVLNAVSLIPFVALLVGAIVAGSASQGSMGALPSTGASVPRADAALLLASSSLPSRAKALPSAHAVRT